MQTPYLIAEIGVNYYDSAQTLGISPLEAAKALHSSLCQSECECRQFQSYKADTLASRHSPAYWDLSKEPTTSQHALFQKFDQFGKEEYEELYHYAKAYQLDFMSTPFDEEAADYLEKMVDIYKIASADLANHPFLSYIAQKRKPVMLSTGASYLYEIDQAVHVLKENGCPKITLLHCVLSYPCQYQDAHLEAIPYLKAVYPDLEIGYSDHTLPDATMQVLSTAYLLGATVIEKHFTMDKQLPGNDHYHAGDVEDFHQAVENFRLIQSILGERNKTVLACEANARLQARRSLVLRHDLKKDHRLEVQDLMAKRPGTGISPLYLEAVVGRKLNKDKQADDLLSWDDI